MYGHFRHTSRVRNSRSFGRVLLLNQIYLTTMCRSQYHSDLSDQSAGKLGLRLGLDLELHYSSIFSWRITKTSTLSSANFTQGNVLLTERTQTMNNKIKLHILGVPMNKLGNQLITTGYKSQFLQTA